MTGESPSRWPSPSATPQVLLAQGKTAAEVRDILEAERDASSVYIAVNTLEYLRKSGRVTAAGAAMAAVLHIKPVLQIQGGKLDAYKKVRGMLQAKKTLLEALRHDLATRFSGMKMAVFSGYSGGDPTLGETWRREVQGRISRLRGGDDLPPPEHLLPHGRGRGGRGLCKTLVKGRQRFRHPRRDRCCILIKI